MTDSKFYRIGPRPDRSKSLFTGLLRSLVFGLIIAIITYFVVIVPFSFMIYEYYLSDKVRETRREDYLADLQDFAYENEMGLGSTELVGEWVRHNRYVYLIVYYQQPISPIPGQTGENGPVENTEIIIEYPGAGIDSWRGRDELVEAAEANGRYQIRLTDGSMTVAINDYTENLYYGAANIAGLVLGAIMFFIVTTNYVRNIIQRIKRFESDVTIVSEIDMNYTIVSEGADEIAKLSTNVERMRRRMLQHIQSEHEARESNTELITSISHDIRTPLTVLMGYIEMMKEQGGEDPVMDSYVAASESTALRLKQLADDMFKYVIAFGDTNKMVNIDRYDAATLLEQAFAEHLLLMHELGYDIQQTYEGSSMPEGAIVMTDAQNLMRIIDNLFSNMRKYADPASPIVITHINDGDLLTVEMKNAIRKNTEDAESNGIGLKTCSRLAALVADKFEYTSNGDEFISRLGLRILGPEPDHIEISID